MSDDSVDYSSTQSDENQDDEISDISVRSFSILSDNDSICSNPILKSRFPDNDHSFNIKVLKVDNMTYKEELVSTLNCYYKESESNSYLIIYFAKGFPYSLVNAKEFMMNLCEFIEKLTAKESYIYLERGHRDYIRIIKILSIVGFEFCGKNTVAHIEESQYRYRILKLKQPN